MVVVVRGREMAQTPLAWSAIRAMSYFIPSMLSTA